MLTAVAATLALLLASIGLAIGTWLLFLQKHQTEVLDFLGKLPLVNLMKLAGIGLALFFGLTCAVLLFEQKVVDQNLELFAMGVLVALLTAAHRGYVTKRRTFIPGVGDSADGDDAAPAGSAKAPDPDK